MTFKSARIKLTGWYLLIIMVISLSFSLFVYRGITSELSRGLRRRMVRLMPQPGQQFVPESGIAQPFQFFENQFFNPGTLEPEALQLLEDVRHRILLLLALINLGIFIGAGTASYFLAGKTLAPIETAMEEQKRFIGDASHELRTPLTVLKSEIEVALRQKNLSSTEARHLLQSNLEEVDKMQQLTNYLLALSRFESDNTKQSYVPVDLAEATTKAISQHQSPLEQKQLMLTTKLNSAMVLANPTSMVELVSILLDNAIKYSKKAGRISIKTFVQDNKATLEIADNGVGIKASDLPYIFNRFYRADLSRSKHQVSGYGLGLSIAKAIVTSHKGTLKASSTLGKKTVFTVSLPQNSK